MKFPNVQDLNGYSHLLSANGCEVTIADYTDRFTPYVDLYLNMLNMQLTYDALRIIGFDRFFTLYDTVEEAIADF